MYDVGAIPQLQALANSAGCPPAVKEAALALVDLIEKERQLAIASAQKTVDALKANSITEQGKVLLNFYQKYQDIYSDLTFLTGRVIVGLRKVQADLPPA
jgi:hypothetical protein